MDDNSGFEFFITSVEDVDTALRGLALEDSASSTTSLQSYDGDQLATLSSLPDDLYSPRGNWNQNGSYGASSPSQILQNRDSQAARVEEDGPSASFFQHNNGLQARGYLTIVAMTEYGSLCLQRMLEQGNSERSIILRNVSDSLIVLMKDFYGQHVFRKLIQKCTLDEAVLILRTITLQREALILAAYTIEGSNSIKKLIIFAKRFGMGEVVTVSLFTGLYGLMTHRTGRHVIKECFLRLDSRQNEVLYEEVIKHSVNLARDPVGCISLNECIDCITGEQRWRLLNHIAGAAGPLSVDPSGNFVVQHVLNLGISDYCDRICYGLRGRYVDLSLKKRGSHVVEKCLQFSRFGIHCFINDIKDKPGYPEKLARDQFGNYVIQTALKISKEKLEFNCYHQFLVEKLRTCLRGIGHTKGGRKVVELIEEQGG